MGTYPLNQISGYSIALFSIGLIEGCFKISIGTQNCNGDTGEHCQDEIKPRGHRLQFCRGIQYQMIFIFGSEFCKLS